MRPSVPMRSSPVGVIGGATITVRVVASKRRGRHAVSASLAQFGANDRANLLLAAPGASVTFSATVPAHYPPGRYRLGKAITWTGTDAALLLTAEIDVAP